LGEGLRVRVDASKTPNIVNRADTQVRPYRNAKNSVSDCLPSPKPGRGTEGEG